MARATRSLFVGLFIALIVLPPVAQATNGAFLSGQGTKARGAGGVAIAMPQDSINGAVNPATIGYVGTRADVGADIFLPRAKSSLGDVTDEPSRADLFLMPAMGGVYKFNRKVSMGFSAVPYMGGGSRYNYNLYNASSGSNPDVTLGVNLMVMQMNPTVSYKINKQNTVGASLVIGIQTFRAFGLEYFETFTQSFADGDPVTSLTNNGNDWAYGGGVRLGWMGNYMDKKLSLGAVYSSKVYMTEFDKYSDLFAEQGDLDTPGNVGLGISYKFTPELTIGFDIMRYFYSDVASISNKSATTGPGSIYPNGDEKHRLGNNDGLGFGWSDQTVYKIGAIYDFNPQWTFRAGWNYGKSQIDESNGEVLMSIMAPATTQNHLTLGATYNQTKNIEWSFSYIHAFEFEQYGPTYIGDTGKIGMYQNSFGLSFGYKL
jgi:long-chain fatty acid transport protein